MTKSKTQSRNALAKDIHNQIENAVRDLAESTILIGKLLMLVRDEELWFELGYADFDDYCQNVAGFSEASARVRIDIATTFGKLKLSRREIAPITKMHIIRPVVTSTTTAKAWLKKARKMKNSELRKAVLQYQKKMAGQGKIKTKKRSERYIQRGIHMSEKENSSFQQAADHIFEMGGKTYGEAIGVMAEAYLAAVTPKRRTRRAA